MILEVEKLTFCIYLEIINFWAVKKIINRTRLSFNMGPHGTKVGRAELKLAPRKGKTSMPKPWPIRQKWPVMNWNDNKGPLWTVRKSNDTTRKWLAYPPKDITFLAQEKKLWTNLDQKILNQL